MRSSKALAIFTRQEVFQGFLEFLAEPLEEQLVMPLEQ